MKKHITNIILILILFTGLSLLLYPSFSDYWNSLHQTRAIASYVEKVADLDQADYERMLAEAREYNRELQENPVSLNGFTDEEREKYDSLLDVSGTGIMGYVDIPKLRVSLPIYHGTDEAVLQIAIGHLEGSSLPVGGLDSHCVISGHRGLPSAKLFSNLDEMKIGDYFMLNVLNQKLTYQVDQIEVVLPSELEYLKIEKGRDLCTLVTCTPYGINTHRLLVRGQRVANLPGAELTVDGKLIWPGYVALAVDAVLAIPLLLRWAVHAFRRKKKGKMNR